MIINRLALVGGFAILSTLVVSPKVQAQTTNVDFSGNVPPAATINASTNATWNGASGLDILTPTLIRAGANLNISAGTGVTFRINSITDNGTTLSAGKTFNDFDLLRVDIQDGNSLIIKSEISPSGNYSIVNPLGVTSPVQPGPITNKDYGVYLTVANNTNILPAGTYRVRVNITLTPQ